MIEFFKSIDTLCVFKSLDGKEHVVHGVNWTMSAKDGEDTCSYGVHTEIPMVDGEFIPYTSLDEETVLSWIDMYTPKEHMKKVKDTLTADMQVKKENVVIPPPWVSSIYPREDFADNNQ